MNLSYLKSFVALADAGSFSEAAAKLNIAQPTLSQHIKKLEEELGAQLILRGKQRSLLTAKGRLALPMAASLLDSYDKMVRRIQSDTLTIAASGNIANYFLGAALRRFNETRGAAVSWRVLQAANPAIVEMAVRREVDVALTEWRPDRRELVSRPWRTEELVVIAAPQSEIAAQRSISSERFLELPLIGGEPGTGTGSLLSTLFGADAKRLTSLTSLGSTEAVKSAVAEGVGYSIVLRGAVRAEIEAGRLAAVSIDGVEPQKTFYVSMHKDQAETEPSCAFADILAEP